MSYTHQDLSKGALHTDVEFAFTSWKLKGVKEINGFGGVWLAACTLDSGGLVCVPRSILVRHGCTNVTEKNQEDLAMD